MRYCIVILLLLLACPVQGQMLFTREHWLNEAGTPIKVNTLLQDDASYIWLGTDDGLYSFNGSVFTKVPDNVHSPITALYSKNNTLWIGYRNGLLAFCNDGIIIPYYMQGKRPQSSINYIQTDDAGMIWLATETDEDDGIYVISNHKTNFVLNTQKGLTDNFIYTFSFLTDKRIIAGSDKGIDIVNLHKGKFDVEAFSTQQGLPDNIVRVLKPIPNSTQYWVGTQEGGIAIFDYKAKKVTQPLHLAWQWGQINDIIPADKDNVWIGTEDGFLLKVKMRNDTLINITPHYFSNTKIYKLLLDKANNIWCATNNGLTMVLEDNVYSIPLGKPYSLSALNTMTCNNDYLWMGEDKDVYRIALKNGYKVDHVFSSKVDVTSLYYDNHKRLWIGTLGDGLWCIDNLKQIRHITTIPNLTTGQVLNIAGYRNELWVSTLNGVEQLSVSEVDVAEMQLIKHHSKTSGVGSDYVYQLYPDWDGHVWMATDGAGVCMYDGKQYHKYDSTSGLNSKVIYSITQDKTGKIWVATLNDGLYSLEAGQWQQHTTTDGLLDASISSIIAKESGQLIAVSKKGINEWFPDARQFRHYNKRLVPNIDSLSDELNCIAHNYAGDVFIPFQDGIIVYENIEAHRNIMPDIHISGVSLFFRYVPLDKHEFSFSENHITIKYDGINYINPERLNYRYALEGFDNSWIATNDATVTFPLLPSGTYTFRVQASFNQNFSNAKEAVYTFTIAPPFWQRWWFLGGMFIVIIIGVYYIQKLRDRSVNKVSQLQQERMIFEYEHLKSQVNPHFLFNSLNTLTSLIEEDQETAIDYTAHLSDLYRNMITYKDVNLIFLSEEMELLEKYTYIQKSRFGRGLNLNINIPSNILRSKKIIPLALQLLVENAIKHNVVSYSLPLVIHITANKNEIVVSNVLQPKIHQEKGAGLGLVNVSRRYFLLTKKEISYGIVGNEYIVKLPLI